MAVHTLVGGLIRGGWGQLIISKIIMCATLEDNCTLFNHKDMQFQQEYMLSRCDLISTSLHFLVVNNYIVVITTSR